MELNTWLDTEVKQDGAQWNESTKSWSVTVQREGKQRVVKPKFLIVATGLGGGTVRKADAQITPNI